VVAKAFFGDLTWCAPVDEFKDVGGEHHVEGQAVAELGHVSPFEGNPSLIHAPIHSRVDVDSPLH